MKGADRCVYLISPYLKLNVRFRDLLDHRLNRDLRVRVIYGKERKLAGDLRDWLDSRPGVTLRFRPHLHGKCYVSEKEAVVTSMNLYEFSQQTNDEFGVRLTAAEDRPAFRTLVAEVNRVWAAAEPLPKPAASPAKGAAEGAGDEPVVLFEQASPARRAIAGVTRLIAGSSHEVRPEPETPTTPAADRISTSQLAKRTGISSSAMFRRLAAAGFIDGAETRGLTPAGAAAGGALKMSDRFGEYVVWPPDLIVPE